MTRYQELLDFVQTVAPLSDDCVEWWGARRPTGYGIAKTGGKSYAAHRMSWALANGIDADSSEMPDVVAHHCDNPPCINPRHLKGTNQAWNLEDARRKGRLDCSANGKKRAGIARPYAFGGKNHRAILSEQDVLAIREHRRLYGTSHKVLARWFGMSNSAMYYTIIGETWKHI